MLKCLIRKIRRSGRSGDKLKSSNDLKSAGEDLGREVIQCREELVNFIKTLEKF
jgi:hypothetical protein